MVVGSYLTSFLQIVIDTEKDLGNLKSDTLTDREQGIFVHEYTHFLQNITSSFGQLHVWNTYDRLRQYIAEINKNGVKDLKLPLEGPVADEQKNLLRIRLKMEGSGSLKKLYPVLHDASAEVVNHQFVKDQVYAALHPDRRELLHLQLELKDQFGQKVDYIFGELAVSEMMAYLMERKYYKGLPHSVYPYMACRKLGEYMGTSFLNNDEFLFALCDVSLLSGFPGTMFYRILDNIIKYGLQLKTGEEVFDHGIQFIYSQGWRVFEDYENNMQGAIHVIDQLLPHEEMRPTSEWISYLLRVGYKIRKETPHFMIRLYREPLLFDGYWNNIMIQFGNASLHNNKNQRWFKCPYDIAAIDQLIQPIYLLAIQEIHNTLFRGKHSCAIYPYCDERKDGSIVDYRCKYEPWSRSLDEKKCAYGALWFLYGLSDKNIVF